MVCERGPSRVTGGAFNKMLYTSVLGSRIVWVVVLHMLATILNGRMMGMSSSSTASRRKLWNIQMSPHGVRVVALVGGETPTRTHMIFNVMGDSALSGARLWGSEIGEIRGSSWIRMGASVSMIIHRTDFFDTVMVRMVTIILAINKCSRVQGLVAH